MIKTIFFDLDDTLLAFTAAEALTAALLLVALRRSRR